MNRKVSSRFSTVLVLLLLVVPAAFAAPRPAKPAPAEVGVLAWLTEALGRFLPAGHDRPGTLIPGRKSLLSSSPFAPIESRGTMDPDGHS
jgi:hypothetical protein